MSREPTGPIARGPSETDAKDRRQALALRVATAFNSILRNARLHGEDNAVFTPVLQGLQDAIIELLAVDGSFSLELSEDTVFVDRQVLRVDSNTLGLVSMVRHELLQRNIHGIRCTTAPLLSELRALVRVLAPSFTGTLTDKGDPARPLVSLTLQLAQGVADVDQGRSQLVQLLDSYAHAVFFVAQYIEQLRQGAEPLPPWAASRTVQDLVDLQRQIPLRFIQLSRTKGGGESYWGFHAANVAVLAISFGERLGLSKRRRHDLGMAALFHDIGTAALPGELINKEAKLSEREAAAIRASPLFAARAILREKEVHRAALERALAAYECHLDLAAAPPGQTIGLPARILAICEAFDALTTTRPYRSAHPPHQAVRMLLGEMASRFDPSLLPLFASTVEPLL